MTITDAAGQPTELPRYRIYQSARLAGCWVVVKPSGQLWVAGTEKAARRMRDRWVERDAAVAAGLAYAEAHPTVTP